MPGDPWQMWETLGFTYFLLIALALIFFAVIAMANWFAPALIVLNGAKAIAAMTTSLRACVRNWLPFLVYGLIGVLILAVAIAVFAGLAGLIGFETVMSFFDGNGGLGTFTFATAACRGDVPAARRGTRRDDVRVDVCELSRHARR